MNDDHRGTAAAWHTGESSLLYAYATTGEVHPGLDGEIEDRLEWVEQATAVDVADRVDDHARLVGLLRHVEPLLAQDRARAVGAEHARLAAIWWRQDNLGGGANRDAGATAQQVLGWIDDVGDPHALGISPGWDEAENRREIAAAAGWREPHVDDFAVRERWEAALDGVRDAYTTAFAEGFWAAVAESCRSELARIGPIPAAAQAGASEHHLAYARLAGAEAALAAAEALDINTVDANAITRGAWYPFEPPALPKMAARSVSGPPRAGGVDAGEPVPAGDAGTATLAAIHADVTRAWLSGSDTVWVTATWAKALRTLREDELAGRLDAVCADRVDDLREALAAATSAPARPDRLEPPVLRRASERSAMPAGWEAVPVGRDDHGEHVEVHYDPRRYDVLIAHGAGGSMFPEVRAARGDPVTDALATSGWELHSLAAGARVWTRDRDAARHQAAARHATGTRPQTQLDDTSPSGQQPVTERERPGADPAAPVRAALARLDRRVSGIADPSTSALGVEP